MASRPHGLPGGSPPDRMRCGDYNGSAPRQPKPRSATIHSGSDARWGVWGAFRGPPRSARQPKPRSATIHSGRDARWGVWGAISGPPTFSATGETEERHDSLGARRAMGGVGGHFGAPHVERDSGGRGARGFTRGAARVAGRG